MKKFVPIFFIMIIGIIWLYMKEPKGENIHIIESNEEFKEEEDYNKEIKKFIQVTATEVLDNKVEEPYYLYIGRKTCPYCREFVKQLSDIKNKTKYTIYYLDSENVKTDKKIQMVGHKFDISGIPCLLKVYTNGETDKYTGSSERELEDWLQLLNKKNK
ncbi:hypothetical protein RZ529_09510 [Enterococcus faecalis]|uniref:hypothetical protein n=1 Tax=Enterococcus faecalis TaxID=1351 RepID=UPI001AD62FB2|nr:hypothetical protein [Enterococcus faecalis]MBO6371839.1 hypothetical protein [Enterococcus faecalis]MBO6379774.1 hypothetical protein [Enterococcus faecalis]MBO6383608.1 hypothetical protein [Enterococcus faecalis]MCO5480899.1 hypothetical protein [Enterococcus faecalis]MDV2914202.1 hypothetical protein [Enterococcus faecalis]